uniref:Uncharacterized protein n=1 Tax=Microplitis mediator bracovirus TaxID=1836595 RepID=A0A1D5APJ3_9VIRU|nr:hypothetical protein A6F54_67 [Microplitis mediator bracovirus]
MSSSSSSSSSSSQCSNSTSFYFIPREWKEYPAATLDCVLSTDIKEHLKYSKRVEGAPISVGGVPAKLEYFGPSIWMRKDGDTECKPSKDYAMRHIQDDSKK